MPPAVDVHFIIHATAFATLALIAAFFILAVAERSIGFANIFGKLLAFWLAVIALTAVAGALTAHRYGGKPFGLDLPWHDERLQPAEQAAPPAEAPPAETPPVETPEPAPNFVQPAPSGG
jgi:hypothetical protein